MKMVANVLNKWSIFLLFSVLAFPSNGMSTKVIETHQRLMTVNKNWENLANDITYTFTPSSEKELVQLHLLNVISYLENQPVTVLNQEQEDNRNFNISILKQYCQAGNFPKNNLTDYRTPIFIDFENTHCAVGQLLANNGLENIAQDISEHQLLSYLGNIEHAGLTEWQQTCGLSLFELALIQPTYGPPIPICAIPSPVKWNAIPMEQLHISKLFNNPNGSKLYGISLIDKLGLKQEIKRFSPKSFLWTSVGSEVPGQILDLVFNQEEIYISVLLPKEDYPHQILKLNGKKWEKIAHFDGGIKSIQSFQNKLYVHGNFKNVNNSIVNNFVVIEKESITPFSPVGLHRINFDHIKASETAMFLTSGGGIYKFKNDTITYVNSIQYYQYITHMSLDADEDSLFVTSKSIAGYNSYYGKRVQTNYINNMLYGHDYPYSTMNFTKCQKVNDHMMISGDFKTSTLTPQINDERYLVDCADSLSAHWYGEGLMYQHGQMYYPILKKGIVLDFEQVGQFIFILKKEGSIYYTTISAIEEKIRRLRSRGVFR